MSVNPKKFYFLNIFIALILAVVSRLIVSTQGGRGGPAKRKSFGSKGLRQCFSPSYQIAKWGVRGRRQRGGVANTVPKVVAVILPLQHFCQSGGIPILNKDLVQKKTVVISPYITTTYINFQINFQISILNKEQVKVQNRRKSLCSNDLPLTPSHGDFPIGRETTLTQRDF